MSIYFEGPARAPASACLVEAPLGFQIGYDLGNESGSVSGGGMDVLPGSSGRSVEAQPVSIRGVNAESIR